MPRRKRSRSRSPKRVARRSRSRSRPRSRSRGAWRSPRCKKGTILRKSYRRKSYRRMDGTLVAAATIAAKCIPDTGLPGKGPEYGISLQKGKLRAFGYSTDLPAVRRRAALKDAVDEYGWLSVFRKLNVVATLLRNTSPGKSNLMLKDRDWVKSNFG